MLLIVILATVFGAIQSCSNAGSFQIDYLKFDDIVKPNIATEVQTDGTFSKKITGGSLRTIVKYGFLKVVDTTEDFCSFSGCPTFGYSVAKREFTIPSVAPGGGYTIKLEATDQDNQLIFCFSGSFTLKKNGWISWKQQ